MSTLSSSKRCCQFSLEEINAVTNQFENKLLGKGGEAMVYFAEIYIGSKKTPVAVKYLKDTTKEFESEIQTLPKIQHPNIVSLIGYCNESSQKILVYEYMEKGCLSNYLKKKKDKPLSWLQRLNICLDVARGLQHLHSETNEFPKGIIHRDVKPENILVGENWVGKLSDFGMLKLSNADQVKSSMVTVGKGTPGYFAPSPSKRHTIDDVVLNLQKVLNLSRCRQFSIEEIVAATNKFDRRKIIGQGDESTVYFAGIYIGSKISPVAVTLFKYNILNFEREIHTLSKIQHPNLVSLIGYCNEFGYQILVYEYMAKGCLSSYLEKRSCIYFSWLERLNVCLGTARGLQHLHTETDEFPKGIVHRDVNPETIFVGENWVGKLSEVKMFSIAGQDQTTSLTIIKGNDAYYAPEYLMLGRATRKSDVYAFGIVLLQVLCGKFPRLLVKELIELLSRKKPKAFRNWAQEHVDSQIRGEMSEKSLTLFIDIIGRSLQENPGKRPSMNDVVLNIQKAIEWQEYENLAMQVEKEYEQTNPSSSNPIKEKVRWNWTRCQICKRRNHEAIDCWYRFNRSYLSKQQ